MKWLRSIGSAIGKVASVGKVIVTTALPIIKALRPAIPEIDKAMDTFEGAIEQGGEVADDFLDRNMETVQAIETWSGRGIAVLGELNSLAVKLRVFSQEQTPETITEDEALELLASLDRFRELVASWDGETEKALELLEAVED